MDVTGGAVPHGPAMRDAWAVTGAFLTAAGAGIDYAKAMADWLQEEGFEYVEGRRVDIDVGVRYKKDREWRLRGAKMPTTSLVDVVGACEMMNVDISEIDLDKLPQRAEEEMIERGEIYPLVFASGRKPAAST